MSLGALTKREIRPLNISYPTDPPEREIGDKKKPVVRLIEEKQ
jgi:hypothetical protein